ncbi:MAG: aminotransferase class I/II-fold pyridoxal phosphate-dependent enzyme [Bacteroidetes bacterium]|nr:aminotransferase class I/II-fold pyridoxal phosphate-dependent enzyme [Bacteroidota bacterium]
MKKELHPQTRAIRNQLTRTPEREHSSPLFLTSSFVFDNAEQARAMFADEIPGNIYSRYSNPNSNELLEKLNFLEGTEDGITTASGMAAMYCSMAALLKSGDHVLACRSVFGSTHQILTRLFPRFGITHSYVDAAKPETWEQAILPNTKMIFVETPSNPALEIIDLVWLGKLAAKHNVILNVDNCFATPILQNPFKLGAHLVTLSATKYIDGQGRVLGGVVLGNTELIKEVRFFARHTGPALSAFNAWLLSKSLETLHLRMKGHCENALKLAEALQEHPQISKVIYPHLKSHPQFELARRQMTMGGGVFSFELKGGLESGKKFLNSLELISHSPNLGDSRTIAVHPASTTHSKLTEEERQAVGITPGLIRISAGLEYCDDILDDILQALTSAH